MDIIFRVNTKKALTTAAHLRRFLPAVILILMLAACQANDPMVETPMRPGTDQTGTAFSSRTVQPTGTNGAPTRAPAVEPRPTQTVAASATILPTPAAKPSSISAGRVIAPILMYHHISDQGDTRYTVPVKSFREQIQYLHDQGYQTVTISQLAEAIRQGDPLPEKPVVITFDDGYLDTYENAFPIMEEFEYTGVVYVITSTLEKGKGYGYMQDAELKALLKAGWEIGSHSISHTDLNKSKLGIGNEMKGSKVVLEERLGVTIKSFSYPFGISNAWIKERVEEYGYQSAVGLGTLVTHTTKHLYFLSRREVYRSETLAGFAKLLLPGAEEQAYIDLLTQTPVPIE